MKVFVSWSGGKESSLACWKVIKRGFEVKYLLNMVSEDSRYSRSHGISLLLLKKQAEAMEIPIVQVKTTWKSYEENFKKAVLRLREEEIEAGVFGDIDLREHRDWVERVCKELKIKAILPLWGKEREKLLKEFIETGFKAIVVAIDVDCLDKELLGERINEEFIQKLKAMKEIDLCGERGEYHTFVYGGPIFKKPLEFITGKKILRDKRCFLEIKLKK
ncbi:MAG: ATP pyrophosphatase [Candidatus Omnitrophica bacterium 4484_70.1]|nr:MAG: ATP pyrophosphatase [Candidatus Omnitrophica bacterium 4484_70.1]